MKNFFFSLAFLLCTPVLSAKTVLVLGDSLSAAYGLQSSEGWVSLLKEKYAKQVPIINVVNGSVSGDTSANGLARLPFLLKQHKPTTVVIALGANDALRGQPMVTLSSNLQAMLKLAQAAGAKVAILGVQMPPNFGPQYTAQMQSTFADFAKQNKLPLTEHMLAPLGTGLEQFQKDTIHPIAAAQPLILKHVLPSIEKAL